LVPRIVSARIALLAYAAAVVVGTSVHKPGLLAIAFAGVLMMAGRNWVRILRKASIAVLAFNAVVTLSYAGISALQGTFAWHYVVLVNLRVVFLTCLTFLFVSRVNLFEALMFSRSLTYLFTLACGQAMTLTRVLRDFRLALRSRSIDQPALGDRYRQVASAGVLLLDKSLHDATEITYAMRSRGVFDD
jgi:cobalt/nickel transport system permease protein